MSIIVLLPWGAECKGSDSHPCLFARTSLAWSSLLIPFPLPVLIVSLIAPLVHVDPFQRTSLSFSPELFIKPLPNPQLHQHLYIPGRTSISTHYTVFYSRPSPPKPGPEGSASCCPSSESGDLTLRETHKIIQMIVCVQLPRQRRRGRTFQSK